MLLLAVFGLFSPFACGQLRLSLESALQQALQANPALAVSEGRVAEARGQRLQAGLRPNPRVAVQSEDVPFVNGPPNYSFARSTEEYLYFAQIIETGGKRKRRIGYADAGIQMTEIERSMARRDIELRVSSAYWTASSARRTRDLLAENLRAWDEDVRYGTNRLKEGVMAEADVIRLQLERDRARADLMLAERDVTQTTINLYRAMARTDFPKTELVDSLENLPLDVMPSDPLVFRERPEFRLAEKTLSQAEADSRLQRANGRPDPEAFLGYKRNTGYDTLYAAVQIDIPIHNRNQGNIASAQARVRIAQSNLHLVEINLKADLEGAVQQYRDQQGLVQTLPVAVSLARETENLARAAFREGAVEILRVLDAIRSRIQTETTYYRALADLHQAAINLRLAEGASFSGPGNSGAGSAAPVVPPPPASSPKPPPSRLLQ